MARMIVAQLRIASRPGRRLAACREDDSFQTTCAVVGACEKLTRTCDVTFVTTMIDLTERIDAEDASKQTDERG
jgi:hypothetical protein